MLHKIQENLEINGFVKSNGKKRCTDTQENHHVRRQDIETQELNSNFDAYRNERNSNEGIPKQEESSNTERYTKSGTVGQGIEKQEKGSNIERNTKCQTSGHDIQRQEKSLHIEKYSTSPTAEQDKQWPVQTMASSTYFEECLSWYESFRIFPPVRNPEHCETCSGREKCLQKNSTRAVACHLDWRSWTLDQTKQYSPDVILAAGNALRLCDRC